MTRPPRRPLFSVVTPVYNPPVDVLAEMIASVREQEFADWELILVDDNSPNPQVRIVLRNAARRDRRITVIERPENGRIVVTSNDGLAAATGEFVVLVDHDDLLTPDALQVMADAIAADPTADYLYSDEDKLDAEGEFYDEFRKPDWSPERLRAHMYTGHLSVLRASLVEQVGGFRAGYDGSQDHDLVLRVTELARSVVHVPEILYHWRVIPGSAAGDVDAKPYAWEAGRRAVADHLDRVGIAGTAEFGSHPGYYRVVRTHDPSTTVSVVIPTRGSDGLVWGRRRVYVLDAVRSVVESGGVDRVEIVVVHDLPTPQSVLDELAEIAGDRLVLVPFSGPFNFSAKCNLGFLASTGDVVVMLNDDVEAISANWLADLVAPLAEPGVGLTGAHLLFTDSTVQHAGLIALKDHYEHVFMGGPDDYLGYFGALLVNRECSGLTAACVALRREVYEEVGGFCEELPGSFNDVDFSFKIRSRGYRLVWLSEVRLFHFESRTRDKTVQPWEHEFVIHRWETPDVDPYLPAFTR
ncbi:glycosyltransferase [Nakamurella flavida]|uniref:Glycosyltransferase n=1 Tax=Nakamurella flavida TaxID=363630 RepID=A0A938YTC7_9ACTN|nr:glycosyltransferase [Nakamurella flavida]MBM9478510.1 glycosyltransferase [Nakamurella flavida]MDP9777663.1 glycosyltransferase involved in cell wall biosynthesis [Nakamurella flavida]